MNAQADRVNTARPSGRRSGLLAGAGVAALTLALLHATPVRAAEYLVANDAQLRAAITAANADADPSATIVLTGSFAVANTNLPLVTKPITIDTRGFTLTGATTNATAVRVGGPYTTGSLTLDGAILGVSGGVASTVIGGSGLQVSVGAVVTNNATITGGAGGQAGGSGGRGVVVTGVNSTLVNNGTITAGISYNGGTSIAGVQVIAGGTLVNNGVIQGANSPGGFSGVGVDLGSAAAPSTLINNGIIRGGSGSSGSSNVGLVVRVVNQPVINTGAIEGGDGSVAVTATGGSSVTLTNSGTLRAGAGQATALQMGTGQLTLELQSGSVIQGNVVASAARTDDILRLGGAPTATFDVSTIGATGQYQNFDLFQKVGIGAWRLVGEGTATTNWDIQQGVLTIGDGGTSGSIIGDVANAGSLAFNRSDTLTYGGVISGSGAVSQSGRGTLILSGVNTYTGLTTITAGVLAVSSDANMGNASGGIALTSGTLRTTASFTSGRAVVLPHVGVLQTDAATTFTLGGVILGAGQVVKTGDGTLVLTADNTYSGGTVISAGALQLGDGGAAGGVVGDIVDNAELILNRAGATTVSNRVLGTGAVRKIGGGTTILTADNTYAGGTTISAGVLQLGDGGTSGSIVGDVIDDGLLAINRSDTATLAGLISGTGGVFQMGGGTTILTGNNSYAGATDVVAGTLRVNGDQSAATGLTTVFSGARLGGSGVIGGDVTVANGGILAPGNSPGTLTINGDLVLSSGSLLDYEFGQSNIVGGPLNDLTVVNGDLTLDGAIDATVTAGGSFGAGVYRVISYTGALTNNGLTVGTMPPGSVVGVQTSVAGQVNLVNSAGVTVNFWDGAAGPTFNGQVNGGTGVWQNIAGNDSWTDITGNPNAGYIDGSFAVFMAAPGTVTVDDGLGAVIASGLQFATGGYTITGDDITLVGPQSIVRVGDGTAAGVTMTATIGSALTGATQLVKTDLGTLVLTGANSYAGGTRIDTGTLQVGDGGATGGLTGDIVDNAALVVNRSGAVALDGVISGSGSLTKLGVGALTLIGANTYTGGTTITGGALQIGNGGTTGSVAGDIVDNGALRFNRSDTLSLGGVISGSGSVSQAGPGTTILTGANSYAGATDVISGMLLINGDQSGATALTSVASGATLGGVGTIGGNVTVADGATLAVGDTGVGTLTINGDLTLGGASRIAFELGQAGVVGGAFNDLVNVGGALTLDGTIDVTQSAGGSYGAGVYRVLNYAGALTNNGLAIGALPPGATAFVQTSVAGQVNLVDIGGLDLSFWDGVAGPKFNGVINGGDGVWQAHGGNDNWTDLNGAVNAGYSDGAVAIFSGAPGTVTVSNTLGAVTASGMQFATDGYVITGDPLTLTGAQATIRVGDGSAAGAGYTATIASILTGASQLVKTDLGTLVLLGANNYTGGTRIDGGTLAIGNGGATGSLVGDIVDNGALVVNRSGALTLNGAISGSGSLTKLGGGELTLTGLNSYAGGTTVGGGGAVRVSSDANLGAAAGALSLQGGTLRAGASFTSGRAILLGSPTANGIDTQGFDVTLGGVIGDGAGNSGGNFLDKVGSGTLTLTGANTYGNRTNLIDGTLALAGAGTIGVGNLVIGAGAVFDISQTTLGARVIQVAGTPTSTIALGSKMLRLGLVNSSSDWTGTITDGGLGGGAGGRVMIDALIGSVRFHNANSYTGGTIIAAGTFALTGNGSLYSGGAVAVNPGTVFDISGLTAAGTTIGDLSGAGTLSLGGKSLTFGTAASTSYTGAITGNGGALVKTGAGTFTLAAANSYTGATTVAAGTLLVNGNQSAATGLTSVASGATLGGSGRIGGDVIVADGGTLAPGNSPGTLTINGGLTLSGGSTLAYELGAANAVGSPLNDLVNVGGNLTLDGAINVAVSPGGSFDIGLYRIVNYGGALTDNGLAIGATPAGADLFVQTSVAGQVNLVNTAGVTLNFWDGAAGPQFNNAVNGGDGVWQASAGGNDWTDPTGAVNAGYSDGAFAIFSGTPGVVTVDNGVGAVTASGLQFASDGYTVAGGPLTLTGPQSVVRVGDGSAMGMAYTATISAQLTGATQLVKTDAGTLVLTGANSFSGGVAINGGRLRISSDANLGAVAGGLSFNGGTLDTTADISSGRAVDLAGQGVFSTNAGTTLTLTGTVSGLGALVKNGLGTLVLSGTGGHTGGTSVGAGTLLVNGDHAAATGLTDVASGATLGGGGTIGGDVRLASGATLSPGAGGAGTLTIGGDLTLASGTQLAYELGQANVAGGALNDLVEVGGDLTLDGTINVTVPTGGAFGAGLYRVFNYGGALTDNGLTLGALPASGGVTVQTSIAGQVNLINFAGAALNFWDGAGGLKNDGAINGGGGTWQVGGAGDSWTDAGGAVNAAYADGALAVFGGVGGVVTVDNGLGQVTAAGLQFATGGYTITGGAIALGGTQATIRVGDGSVAGAGYTATVASALSGAAQLVKTDAGTLVLGGANSYAGGTLISGGVLRISSDANLGAAAGNVTLDGGTLATSASLSSARGFVTTGAGAISTAGGTTLTLTGPLTGPGVLTKTGDGTLLLAGDGAARTGATVVGAGTLRVDGVLGGATTVATGGRLEGVGRVGGVVNRGAVAPGGEALGTLTLTGGYAGDGGTLEIATTLGGDASPTDRLVVQGDTSGATEVVLTNRGGLGAQTVEGVKIIDIAGASNGAFTLRGDYQFQGSPAVIAGAYGYRLYKGGVATPADGDWYLRSALLVGGGPQVPLYQPGVPVYETYGQTMLALNALGTMQQRIGERQWGTTPDGQRSGLWGRVQANRYRPNATVSTSLADLDLDSWNLEFGADHVLSERKDATLVLGVLAGLGEAEAEIGSVFGDGSIKTKDYSAGATLSWYGPRGYYVDGQVRATWFDSDLRSTVLGALADGNNGHGQAYSVEFGKRSPIDAKLSFTPQVQVVYSTVGFDRFVDPNDAEVSSGRGESLKTRWGLAVNREDAGSHLYAVGSLSYEWLDGTVSNVSGTPVGRANDRLWGELGVGGTVTLGNLRLYSEASADTAINDFGHSYSVKGTVGLRLAF
jgi:fibronectin-binding autotransporter adhesin